MALAAPRYPLCILPVVNGQATATFVCGNFWIPIVKSRFAGINYRMMCRSLPMPDSNFRSVNNSM